MSFYAFSTLLLGALPPAMLFFLNRFDRKLDIASPLGIMAWTIVVSYSLKSFYMAYALDAGHAFRTQESTGDLLYIGQFIVLLATFSLAVGYLMVPKLRFRPRIVRGQRNALFWKIVYWGVFALCLVLLARLFFLKDLHQQLLQLQFTSAKFYVDEEGTKSSLGFLLISADILIIYFLYYITLGGKLLRPNIYVFAILFVVLTYFLSSQRTGVLNIVIGALIVGRHSLVSFRSKTALKRLVLVVTVLSVLSLASNIRQERREVGLSELSVAAGIESTLEHVFEGFYAIDPIKITAIAVLSDERLYGESFVMFIVAPIPRILWPEKPNVRLGPYVGQDILGFNNNSGAPPSGIGELYLNFGTLGVAMGMLLLGMVLAVIRNTYVRATEDQFARVRYAAAFMIVIHFMIADFSYAILFVIKYGIAILICERYWRSKLASARPATLGRADETLPETGTVTLPA